MRVPTMLMIFVLGLIGLPAWADTPDDDQHAPPQDKVSFTLSAEDWVETSTARVDVEIDATLPGSDAGKIRAEMQKAVAGLAGCAPWRFARFDHAQDQSGLETWHAALETRLKESELGGLADKAKAASKPGLQIKLNDIDFTPTLAETEAVKAKLRSLLYAGVNEELKRLNDAEPGRNFRAGEIDFDTPEAAPHPVPMHMRLAVAPAIAMPVEDTAPVTVQEKVTMNATVTLEEAAPKTP